jgi:small subunit ribosomal protein S1
MSDSASSHLNPFAGNPAPAPFAPAPVSPPTGPRSPGADVLAAMEAGDNGSLDRAADEALEGVTEQDLAGALAAATPQAAEPAPGALVRGRIANIGSQDVLIDFGVKWLGVMPLSDFDTDEKYALGDPVEVAVVGEAPRGGLVAVSRRKARQAALLRELAPGTLLEGQVTGMNKGGLEVNLLGLRGFIPASQVDQHFMKDISNLIGQTVRAEVVKYDADDGSIVLSRRNAQLREATERKDRLLAEMEVGQVRRGRVRDFAPFGAFVDLGGVDALLHITDMSWGRVEKPEDVLQRGAEIDVKIIKINREKKKISLSLKGVIPDPWTLVARKYHLGMKVQGRVVRLQPFGAFVELEPGVDGLVPLSEMSWTRRPHNPSEMLKEGEVIEVCIIGVEPAKRRISLSLKQATEDPWSVAAAKYVAGTMVKGTVARVTEFGAFVALEEGIDGLLHISELSDTRVRAVTDRVKPGQEVEVRVLGVDPQAHKISLSMKPPPREPTPEELAQVERERAAAQKKREKAASRRGGLTISWDQGLGSLDPSKFGK